MKKLSKFLFVLLIVSTVIQSGVAQNYNQLELEKIRAFLLSPSAESSKKNYQQFDFFVNEDDVNSDEWLGLEGNGLRFKDVDEEKRLEEISWNSKKLAGNFDLSNFSYLEKVDLNLNQISSLDVSNNVSLRKLSSAGNQLEYLILNNTDNLEYLSSDRNKLKQIELSLHANLLEVNLNNNQLEVLDISSSTKIKRLLCVDNNLSVLKMPSVYSSLEQLECYRNSLSIKQLPDPMQFESNFPYYYAPQTSEIIVRDRLTIDLSDNYMSDGGTIYNWYDTSNFLLTESLVNLGDGVFDASAYRCQTIVCEVEHQNYSGFIHDVQPNKVIVTLAPYNDAELDVIKQFLNQESVNGGKNYEQFDLTIGWDLNTDWVANMNFGWVVDPFSGESRISEIVWNNKGLSGDLVLTGFSYLKHLEIMNNSINSVDVSESPLLEVLYCAENKMTFAHLPLVTSLPSGIDYKYAPQNFNQEFAQDWTDVIDLSAHLFDGKTTYLWYLSDDLDTPLVDIADVTSSGKFNVLKKYVGKTIVGKIINSTFDDFKIDQISGEDTRITYSISINNIPVVINPPVIQSRYYNVVISESYGAEIYPGVGAHQVKEWEDFVFTIRMNNDNQSLTPRVLTSRNEILEPQVLDGLYRYTLKDVRSDIDIKIEYINFEIGEGNTVGIVDAELPVKVYTQEELVFVEVSKPEKLTIFTILGQIKTSKMIDSGTTVVQLSTGIYIVKVGEKTYKIRIS